VRFSVPGSRLCLGGMFRFLKMNQSFIFIGKNFEKGIQAKHIKNNLDLRMNFNKSNSGRN
jgi:hypothetical protein